MPAQCHTLPHVFGHIPTTGAYNHFIYTISFYNAAIRNYFMNLHTIGQDSPPTLPAQRACSSESGTCTSTASSGSPGSCKVERSESDCGLSKVRGCSLSIMDAHSHNHLHGSISILASPHPCVSSPGGTSGFDSPHPSTSLHLSSSGLLPSSCICSPSSSEEESSVQARRQWVPSSAMWSASWGVQGTKFANVTAILSSAQLRSLATPWAGTHSASSLARSYARMLPSNMRPHAMQR